MHNHSLRPEFDRPPSVTVRFGILLIVLVSALLSTALVVRPLAAQSGGVLTYNTITFGQIDATGLASYTFDGTAGDLITARVLGVSGGLNPSVQLFTLAGATIVRSDDYFLSDRVADAFVSFVLPQTGSYLLMIEGGGSQGGYVLQLNGRPPVQAEPLAYDAPVRAEIPASPPPQYWTFTAGNCPTTLTITNETGGDPFTFPYTAIVRAEDGRRLGELRGGRALQNRLTVPANSGRYEVELASANVLTAGTLLLTITCAERQPDCNVPVPALIVPPTPTPTATAPAGQFLLIQSGGGLVYPQQDITGALSAAVPLLAHPFTATAGDWISAEVTSLTNGLDSYIRLISPSAVAHSLNDAAFPMNRGDTYFSAFLTETGTYTLLVGAQNGTTGDYLLRFTGRTPVGSTPLTFGVPQLVAFPPPSAIAPPPNTPQYFTFTAQDCPTTLTLTDRSGFAPFAAIVRDERGVVIARLRGEPLTEARLTVAPRSGAYEVEVLSMADDRGGTLELLVSCAGDAPLCGTFGGLPVSTPRPGWTPNRPTATPTPGPSPTASATPTLPPCPPGVVSVPQPFIDSYARLAPDTVRQVPTASVGTGVPELEIAPVRPSQTPGGPTRTPPSILIEVEPRTTLATEDPAAIATRFAEELTRNPAVGTRVIVDCGGVGYEVTCSGHTLAGLPAAGGAACRSRCCSPARGT